MNQVVDMINEIEWLRKQLQDLEARLEADERANAVVDAAGELQQSAIALEGQLFDVHLTGAREDAFRGPMKLYGRLSALASDIGGWGADFPPTEQQIEVNEVLKERLNEARDQYEVLAESQLAAFNDLLKENNLGGIVIAKE
jgi:hypothetical protein